jgi:hypothetical protein
MGNETSQLTEEDKGKHGSLAKGEIQFFFMMIFFMFQKIFCAS